MKNKFECCGVPSKFHGTACGWTNASWQPNPTTIEDKAAMWDRMQFIINLPESPMKGAFLNTIPTINAFRL